LSERVPSSSSLISTTTEDDYVRVHPLKPVQPLSSPQQSPVNSKPGAMLPPPRRQPPPLSTGSPASSVASLPRYAPGPATRQSSVSSLASNFSTLSDKMARTNIGSQATGFLNAARSAASNQAMPKFVPNLPSTLSASNDSRRVPPSLPGRPSPSKE